MRRETENVLGLNDDIDTYRPRTKETRAAYEDLLTMMQGNLGAQPPERPKTKECEGHMQRGEHCEQLELTRVPLLLILGGLSRKVRANPFLLPVLLVDVSSYASLAAVGAHVNGFLVIDVI